MILNFKSTKQNTYSIRYLLDTVTTQWLDSDSVTSNIWWQLDNWVANGSVVTMLPAVVNGDYTVTVQSPCSHCVL